MRSPQIRKATVGAANDTKVSVGNVSTTVLAQNKDRIEAVLINDSDETIYITRGATAVLNQGSRLNANGGAVTIDNYFGIITGICATGGKNLCISEI